MQTPGEQACFLYIRFLVYPDTESLKEERSINPGSMRHPSVKFTNLAVFVLVIRVDARSELEATRL